MKLFQIEEPDGSPTDPEAPGAAVGIDLSGAVAQIAYAVGGNTVVLPDREDFPLELSIPAASAPADQWERLLEGARLRAERALARPVTHAVIVLADGAAPELVERVRAAASAAGLAVLDVIAFKAVGAGQARSCAAAALAEDLAPRPGGSPLGRP